MMPRKKIVKNNILMDEWFKHFQSLLERNDEQTDDIIDDGDANYDDDCLFNRPISKDEVLLAIRKLKLKKAAGPDGLVGEFYKHGCDMLLPFLVQFFNHIFDRGVYPENWTESVILPLYKKGDVNNPGNYRGISLTDICSKIFGNIINTRLQSWVDENNTTGEVVFYY
jgi:hypothetical protein